MLLAKLPEFYCGEIDASQAECHACYRRAENRSELPV